MDIALGIVVIDGIYRGIGVRAAYRGLRKTSWNYTDWRDPDPARIAARSRERDRIRRKWGGIWARGLDPHTSANLLARLRAGKAFDIMEGGHSYHELMIYNHYSNEQILETAENMFQTIRAGGAVGPYARLYARLNNPGTRLEAETDIIKMCSRNWHRKEQYQHFMQKIAFSKKAADKLEKRRAIKFWLQMMGELYKNFNQDLNKILEFLLKILGKLG